MREKRSWLKKNRRMRPQHVPIMHMLPSAVTLVGMFFGISTIRWAAAGEWEKAAIGIIAAYVADALDGGLARLLKVTSRMGAELDSLADMVSFGVAPALLAYHYTQNNHSSPFWAFALFYAMSISLRLARFNVTEPERHMLGFFQGVPSPPAALLVIAPIVLDYRFQVPYFVTPYVYSLWLFFTCLLVVSKVPTFSLKKRSLHKRSRAIFLMIFCIIIATISLAPWLIFILFVLGYLLLIPVSAYQHRQRVKQLNLEEEEDPAAHHISE